MIDIFNLGNFVRMKIKDIQFIQVLEVPNALNIILTQHKHSESGYCVKMRDFFDLVVIEIKEDQVWE
jgi:hypothetical protein